ncbi:hypothetical protein B5V03_34765 [Bradyrhizobium betae]|uniref:Uncharacterized protein n=1 Tax=Bradyrhizobium betae TaxID=244734 RepID=A0A4Q1UKV2_9BRAD|nr:hypothetical protein B5V03_34765 [Bradyrhizobium betae]
MITINSMAMGLTYCCRTILRLSSIPTITTTRVKSWNKGTTMRLQRRPLEPEITSMYPNRPQKRQAIMATTATDTAFTTRLP